MKSYTLHACRALSQSKYVLLYQNALETALFSDLKESVVETGAESMAAKWQQDVAAPGSFESSLPSPHSKSSSGSNLESKISPGFDGVVVSESAAG